MGEIKGQLLAIILVLIVFGAISVALVQVFKDTADQVSEKTTGSTAAAQTEANKTRLLSYYGE